MAAVDEKLCDERYANIVTHLEDIKANQRQDREAREKILDLLRGKDGDPGLVDRVRDHDKTIRRIWTGTVAIGLCLLTNIGRWIFSRFS